MANCYSKCYNKSDVNVALCSKSNNNKVNTDAYSNYTSYVSNAYGNSQFELKTYIKCRECKVSNEDDKGIV